MRSCCSLFSHHCLKKIDLNLIKIKHSGKRSGIDKQINKLAKHHMWPTEALRGKKSQNKIPFNYQQRRWNIRLDCTQIKIDFHTLITLSSTGKRLSTNFNTGFLQFHHYLLCSRACLQAATERIQKRLDHTVLRDVAMLAAEKKPVLDKMELKWTSYPFFLQNTL